MNPAGASRVLLGTGAACLAGGWIAEITAAVIGPVPAWPNWTMLVAVTGLMVSNLIRPTRPRTSVVAIVAMAILSIVSVVGSLSARL